MTDEFLTFLKDNGGSFRKAADDELKKLDKLSEIGLPDSFKKFLSQHVLNNELKFEDEYVFYGIDRMYEENFDYVPGANIYPLGLLTFASTLDGDAICIDIHDNTYPVRQCSHDLLSDEEEISYYKKEMITLNFNYENVIKVSPLLADGGFDGFVEALKKEEAGTYSVTEILANL